MPTTTQQAEYEALIAERYGRPLAAILEEQCPPVADLLKERRRLAPPPPARRTFVQPEPDPRWAEHRAVLEAAIQPRRRPMP
ncbi:hypothetical protein [Streptomyces olivoreticuli]|uniref:hypothetical protein n=1 Tax=Streptomyces olivoreticuli TaxID=68246 RepID=UPI000E275CBE|nr:hypothetical protein [Streptomyces olivoreticuli]